MKICIHLVKKVKKYGFSDRTQSVQTYFLQGGKSILEKGQEGAKGPNENFWASEWYLEPHFSNLALKVSTWQPCTLAYCMQSERGILVPFFRNYRMRAKSESSEPWPSESIVTWRQSNHMLALIAGDRSSILNFTKGSQLLALRTLVILMRFRNWVPAAAIQNFVNCKY